MTRRHLPLPVYGGASDVRSSARELRASPHNPGVRIRLSQVAFSPRQQAGHGLHVPSDEPIA